MLAFLLLKHFSIVSFPSVDNGTAVSRMGKMDGRCIAHKCQRGASEFSCFLNSDGPPSLSCVWFGFELVSQVGLGCPGTHTFNSCLCFLRAGTRGVLLCVWHYSVLKFPVPPTCVLLWGEMTVWVRLHSRFLLGFPSQNENSGLFDLLN